MNRRNLLKGVIGAAGLAVLPSLPAAAEQRQTLTVADLEEFYTDLAVANKAPSVAILCFKQEVAYHADHWWTRGPRAFPVFVVSRDGEFISERHFSTELDMEMRLGLQPTIESVDYFIEVVDTNVLGSGPYNQRFTAVHVKTGPDQHYVAAGTNVDGVTWFTDVPLGTDRAYLETWVDLAMNWATP